MAPEPAVLLQYPIKLQAKQQGTEGSRWQTDSKPGFTAYFTSVKCFLFRLLPEGACDKSFSTASPSKFIPTPYKSTDNLILTYPLHFKQERRSFQGFLRYCTFLLGRQGDKSTPQAVKCRQLDPSHFHFTCCRCCYRFWLSNANESIH